MKHPVSYATLTRRAKSSHIKVLSPGTVIEILQRHLKDYLTPEWQERGVIESREHNPFDFGMAVNEASRELGALSSSRLSASAIIEILRPHLKNYLAVDWCEWGETYDGKRNLAGHEGLNLGTDVGRDAYSRRRRKRARDLASVTPTPSARPR